MTDHDSRWVTWDRWDAEHADLTRRVEILEADAQRRRDRQWMLLLALVTAVVLPLLLEAILAVAQLRGG